MLHLAAEGKPPPPVTREAAAAFAAFPLRGSMAFLLLEGLGGDLSVRGRGSAVLLKTASCVLRDGELSGLVGCSCGGYAVVKHTRRGHCCEWRMRQSQRA
jgi:hypothetical protein